MRGIIDRVCDADMATRGDTDALRERMCIDVVIAAAETMQPRQRKGQTAIAMLTAVQTALAVAIMLALVVMP